MINTEAIARYQRQLESKRQSFLNMAKRVKDLRPVFDKFLPIYSKIIDQNFESKGKIMQRERWLGYSPDYLKYKQKKFPGKPMLVITGKLRDEAIHFKKKVDKDKFKIFMPNDDYFFYVSDREKYGRKYFYTKEKTLPIQAWNILIEQTKTFILENEK